MDARIQQHAKILVNHSIKLKKGETVLIRPSDTLDLAGQIAIESYRIGADAVIDTLPTDSLLGYYEVSTPEYLAQYPKASEALVKASDAIIYIYDEKNPRALTSIDPKKQMERMKVVKPLREETSKKRWTTTLHPTASYARQAGMPLDEYRDFVYGAVLQDWEKESDRVSKLAGLMNLAEEINVRGKNTDLTFSKKGRKSVVDVGENNMPGGEVYTSAIENSANGMISFDHPAVRFWNEAKDVRLHFVDGQVVDYSASKGYKLLKAAIETDEGSHRIGEFGLGTNQSITRPIKVNLFDEKEIGTAHIALGYSFPNTDGSNESAIHWDFITKPDEVVFDETPVLKNGKFTSATGL